MAAIELTYIDEAIEEAEKLTYKTKHSSFPLWHRNTQVMLRRTFGDESSVVGDFCQVNFEHVFRNDKSVGALMGPTREQAEAAFELGRRGAIATLKSARWELERYGARQVAAPSSVSPVDLVVTLCRRFPRAARRLSVRHDPEKRSGIEIKDEYDVQDVMHAFLNLHFDDVRPEETTPSFAGASSRVDFVLKNERIGIEVKKTRPGLTSKEARDQLATDIVTYGAHPDFNVLVCFVYDPDRYIKNAAGFEADLQSVRTDKLDVRVVIAPRD
jgi:hypothetical protein